MTRNLFAISAGFFGAALLIGAMTGSVIGSVLGPFAPTPLAAVGLGLGLNQVPFGLLGGVAAVGVLTGSLAIVALYIAVDGLPSALLTTLALSRRRVADGTSDWLPAGTLAALAAVYGALVLAVVLLGFQGGETTLKESFRAWLSVQTTQLDLFSSPAESELMLDTMASIGPGIMAFSFTGRLIVSMVLAQWLVTYLGSAVRETPIYRNVRVPAWAVGLFVGVAVLAILAPSNVGYAATNMALVLAMPVLLQGLAVVHTAVRQMSNGGLWLVVFYGVFVSLMTVMALLVVVLGVLDHVMNIRGRLAAGGQG